MVEHHIEGGRCPPMRSQALRDGLPSHWLNRAVEIVLARQFGFRSVVVLPFGIDAKALSLTLIVRGFTVAVVGVGRVVVDEIHLSLLWHTIALKGVAIFADFGTGDINGSTRGAKRVHVTPVTRSSVWDKSDTELHFLTQPLDSFFISRRCGLPVLCRSHWRRVRQLRQKLSRFGWALLVAPAAAVLTFALCVLKCLIGHCSRFFARLWAFLALRGKFKVGVTDLRLVLENEQFPFAFRSTRFSGSFTFGGAFQLRTMQLNFSAVAFGLRQRTLDESGNVSRNPAIRADSISLNCRTDTRGFKRALVVMTDVDGFEVALDEIAAIKLKVSRKPILLRPGPHREFFVAQRASEDKGRLILAGAPWGTDRIQRPICTVERDPRAWWHYALLVVIARQREIRPYAPTLWHDTLKAIRTRSQYVESFTSHVLLWQKSELAQVKFRSQTSENRDESSSTSSDSTSARGPPITSIQRHTSWGLLKCAVSSRNHVVVDPMVDGATNASNSSGHRASWLSMGLLRTCGWFYEWNYRTTLATKTRTQALKKLKLIEESLSREQIALYRALAAVSIKDINIRDSHSPVQLTSRFHELDCVAVELLAYLDILELEAPRLNKDKAQLSPRTRRGVDEKRTPGFLGFDIIDLLAPRTVAVSASYGKASESRLHAESSFFALECEFGRRLDVRIDDLIVTTRDAKIACLSGSNLSFLTGGDITLGVRELKLVAGPSLTPIILVLSSLLHDDGDTLALPTKTALRRHPDCQNKMPHSSIPSFLKPVFGFLPKATLPPVRSKFRRITVRISDVRIDIDGDGKPALCLLAESASLDCNDALTSRWCGLEIKARNEEGAFLEFAKTEHCMLQMNEAGRISINEVQLPGHVQINFNPVVCEALRIAMGQIQQNIALMKRPRATKHPSKRIVLKATVSLATLSIPNLADDSAGAVFEVDRLSLAWSSLAGDKRVDASVATLAARNVSGSPIIEITASAETEGKECQVRDAACRHLKAAPSSNTKVSSAALLAVTILDDSKISVFASFGNIRAQISPLVVEAIAPAILQCVFSIANHEDPEPHAPSCSQQASSGRSVFVSTRVDSLTFNCYGREDSVEVVTVTAQDLAAHLHTAQCRWRLNVTRARVWSGPRYSYRNVLELRDTAKPLCVDYDYANRIVNAWLTRPRAILSGKFFRELCRFIHIETEQVSLLCEPFLDKVVRARVDTEESTPPKCPINWNLHAVWLELLAPRSSHSDDIVAVTVQNLGATSIDDSPTSWPQSATSKRSKKAAWKSKCRVHLRQCELYAAVACIHDVASEAFESFRLACTDGDSITLGAQAFQRVSDVCDVGLLPAVPRWRPLSKQHPTNFRIAIDTSDEGMRISVEDCNETGVVIDASLAEYYAFLSACYYDNYLEGSRPWVPPESVPLSPYGSDHWIKEMLDDHPSWELALRFSSVSLHLSLDDYDGNRAPQDCQNLVPSLYMAKRGGLWKEDSPLKEQGADSNLEAVPTGRLYFATIHAESLLVVVANGRRAVAISAGAQRLSLRDERKHVVGEDPPYSLCLSPPKNSKPSRRSYVCEPKFGLGLGRHSIVPLGYFRDAASQQQSTRGRWAPSLDTAGARDAACLVTIRVTDDTVSVAVRVNWPRILAKDLGLVWLLADYFKLYFTQPEDFQGPPAYIEQQRLPPQRPPRSIDVKVVGMRPHVVVLESDLSEQVLTPAKQVGRDPKAVSLSVESGVYVQWMNTADDSLHVEVAAHGLQVSIESLIEASRRAKGGDEAPGCAYNRLFCDSYSQSWTSRIICGGRTSFGLAYCYDARFDHIDARFESPLSHKAVSAPRESSVLAADPVKPVPSSACRTPGGSISGRFAARGEHEVARDVDRLSVARRPIAVLSGGRNSNAGTDELNFGQNLAGEGHYDEQRVFVVATLEDVLLLSRIALGILGPYDDAKPPEFEGQGHHAAGATSSASEPFALPEIMNTDSAVSTLCIGDNVDLDAVSRVPQKSVSGRSHASPPELKSAGLKVRFGEAFTQADESSIDRQNASQQRMDDGSTLSARIRIDSIDIAMVDSVLEEFLPIIRVRLRSLSCAYYLAHDIDAALRVEDLDEAALQTDQSEASGDDLPPVAAASHLSSDTARLSLNECVESGALRHKRAGAFGKTSKLPSQVHSCLGHFIPNGGLVRPATDFSIGADALQWRMRPSLAFVVGAEAAMRPLATHVIISAPSISADYFNSTLKCWEPLVEPFEIELVIELSSSTQTEHEQPAIQQASMDIVLPNQNEDELDGSRQHSGRSSTDTEEAHSLSRFRGNGVCIRAPNRLGINLTDAAVEPLARACSIAAAALMRHREQVKASSESGLQQTQESDGSCHSQKQSRASAGRHSEHDIYNAYNCPRSSNLIAENATRVNSPHLPGGTQSSEDENVPLSKVSLLDSSDTDVEYVPWQVEHVRAPKIDETRHAFLLSNQTGLELRAYQPPTFLMPPQKYRKTPQYLIYVGNSHKVRINFPATRTIPYNRRIREVAFAEDAVTASQFDRQRWRDKAGGPSQQMQWQEFHDPEREEIDVQLPGFRWVRVPMSEFRRPGVSFHILRPMIGSIGAGALLAGRGSRNSWALANALRLAADVKASGGGRTLALRSVFGVRNCTGHALEFRFDTSDLLWHERTNYPESSVDYSQVDADLAGRKIGESKKTLADCFDAHTFVLQSNDYSHVPVAAIHDALIQSKTQSLGALRLRPATTEDVTTAMGAGSPNSQPLGSDEVAFERPGLNRGNTDFLEYGKLGDSSMRNGASLLTSPLSTSSSHSHSSIRDSSFGAAEEKSHMSHAGGSVATKTNTIWLGSDFTASDINIQGQLSKSKRADFGDTRIPLRHLVMQSRRQFAEARMSMDSAAAFKLDDAVVRIPYSGGENLSDYGGISDASGTQLSFKCPSLKCPIIEDHSLDMPSPGLTSFGTPEEQYQPPICYCIEVRRSPLYPAQDGKNSATSDEPVHAPVDYEINIHPPLRITNNLAEEGHFELVHASSEHSLWNLLIPPGTSIPVHTVDLDTPLALRVSIPGFCHSVDGPAVIHPRDDDQTASTDVNTHATVVDDVGQKLHICVSSRIGGGGQRHVIVYVPFWMINLTQYSIRYAQEGAREQLPAGTLPASVKVDKPEKAATTGFSVPNSRRPSLSLGQQLSSEHMRRERSLTQPPHEQAAEEIDEASLCSNAFMFNFNVPATSVRTNSSLENSRRSKFALTRKHNASGSHGGASATHRRRGFASAASTLFTQSPQLQIQIDGSEWSSSFSLDTIGVSQVLSVKHPTKGLIELGFSISFAPGARSGFTKLVRFVPRFIILNRLGHPLKLFQALGLNRVEPITEVPPGSSRSFHLPQARAERNLQLQLSGAWEKTPPFPVDVAHDFFLRVPRTVNEPEAAFSSRGDEYTVQIPASAQYSSNKSFELGLWLETDWKQRGIVVKQIKPRTFAQQETDITKGDELLEVNQESLKNMSFNDALSTIRAATTACVRERKPIDLRFRSVESRMRMIRMRALHRSLEETVSITSREDTTSDESTDVHISVEIKAVGASVVLEVVYMDTKFPPYRIVNRSASHRILYRQKEVQGAPWLELSPRSSVVYVWEDPMKSHRLQLRVAADSNQANRDAHGAKPRTFLRLRRLGLLVSDASAAAAGGATRTILMDEINQKEKLPIPSVASEFATELDHIYARVDAEGPTRVLSIIDKPDIEEQIDDLRQAVENSMRNVDRARRNEFERGLALQVEAAETSKSRHRDKGARNVEHGALRTSSKSLSRGSRGGLLQSPTPRLAPNSTIKPASIVHERQIPSHLGRRNQQLNFGPTAVNTLFVEVMEARNLCSRTLNGLADPYCILVIKTPFEKLARRKRFHTYYVEKTLNPKWHNQLFELNIPPNAVETKRGVMLRVKVKDFSLFGTHAFLGQCDVQVSNLQDEGEHTGWFPLMQRSERIYRSQDIVTGFLRLRVRWVYTRLGLLRSKFNAATTHRKQLEQALAAQQAQLRSLQMQQHKQYLGRVLSRQLTHNYRDTSVLGVFRKFRPNPRSIIGGRHGAATRRRHVRRTNGVALANQIDESSEEKLPHLMQMAGLLSPRANTTFLHEKTWLQKWGRAKAKLMKAIREGRDQISEVEEDATYAVPKVSKSEYFMHKMCLAYSKERLAILKRIRESYTRVKTEGGMLEIRPLQALNLKIPDRHVFLNVRYGPTVGVRSAPSNPGVVHSWGRDHSANTDILGSPSKLKRDTRFPDVLQVQVEEGLNKSFGILQLSIFAEHVTSHTEIGRVELPMMNVLECLSARDEYVRWFPLAPSGDCIHFEGDDGEKWWVHGSEDAQSVQHQDRMCIQLALRLEPFRTRSLNPTKFYACAVLAGVSVTLSKSKPAVGLLQATVSDVELTVEESSARTRLSTSVNWIQIDNQLPKCTEAVVLAPTLVDSLQPVFQFRISRNNSLSSENLLSFNYISVMLQELDVCIDQGLLLELWHFVSAHWRNLFSASRRGQDPSSQVTHQTSTQRSNGLIASQKNGRIRRTPGSYSQTSAVAAKRSKVYIERLWLFPVKVNLTIVKGADTAAQEHYPPVGDNFVQHFHGLALQAFIKLLADFLLSVSSTLNGAPIKLNALFVWHIFNTSEHIASSLREHYTSSLLRQLYRVVASLDYIGNPMSLVNTLGTGVRDFFFEPVEGLFLGPSAFALGAVRGTLSLVSNATSGILSTTARVTSTVGKIVAYPILDADYNRWRLSQHQRGRQSNMQPFIDVGNGFVRGITGIVQDPYRGAQRDGAKGFVTGLLRGVIGLAVKPVVGIIDAYAHATEHLQKITTHIVSDRRAPVRRLRFGPAFGLDSRLLPYDFAMALSHATVFEHPLEKRRSRLNVSLDIPEVVVWSEILGGPQSGKLLFVTLHRAVCAKIRTDHGLLQTELEWAALLSDGRARVEARLKDMGNAGGLELQISRRPATRKVRDRSPRDAIRTARGPVAGSELSFHRAPRWLGAEYDFDRSFRVVTVKHDDRKSLRFMHSAIQAVLGNFDNSVSEARDGGLVRTSRHRASASVVVFGCWRFGADVVDPAPTHLKGILDQLSYVDWVSRGSSLSELIRQTNGEGLHPSQQIAHLTLAAESHPLFERAQLWHRHARNLAAKAKRDPRDTVRMALIKQKLNNNIISAREFEQFIEGEELVSKAPDASMPIGPLPTRKLPSSTMSTFPSEEPSSYLGSSRSSARLGTSHPDSKQLHVKQASAKNFAARSFRIRLPLIRRRLKKRSFEGNVPEVPLEGGETQGDTRSLRKGHGGGKLLPSPVEPRHAPQFATFSDESGANLTHHPSWTPEDVESNSNGRDGASNDFDISHEDRRQEDDGSIAPRLSSVSHDEGSPPQQSVSSPDNRPRHFGVEELVTNQNGIGEQPHES